MDTDDVDQVIAALRAHVEPALDRTALRFIESDASQGDEWMLVDDCLQFALLAGHDIPDAVLDQVAEVLPEITLEDHEAPRTLNWIRLIREARSAQP